MVACTDELGTDVCNSLAGLWAADGSCRWPTAELCLKACGQCPRVEAALACQSLPDECEWHADANVSGRDQGFCNDRVDWHAFFERVTSDPELSKRGARVISSDAPWLAEFPQFLTDAEADEMIRVGLAEGLRDEDEHPAHIRNVSVTNCDSANCMQAPIVNELSGRLSAMLGAPSRNFESMEFVRYEAGQHYVWHPDEYSWQRKGWSASRTDPVHVLSGPRVLTFFMYLSNVDEGGETGFMGTRAGASKVAPTPAEEAKLKVRPEKGKAILWANMRDEWRTAEPAAVHRAFPVRRGVKWASTLWVHAAGFRIPELYAGLACAPR